MKHKMGHLPAILQTPYSRKVRALFGPSLIAYLPLWEASGAIAYDISGNVRNGTYANCTLANALAPWGKYTPLFNGTSSLVDIYSAALNAAFNKSEGSLMIAAKVNTGVWTDATIRRLITIRQDNNNIIYLERHTSDNCLRLSYTANATGETKIIVVGLTGFFTVGITWSVTGDQVRMFINGCQIDSTNTVLGAWAAGGLSATSTCIGSASTTPSAIWSGWLGAPILLNRAATIQEMMIASDRILSRYLAQYALYYGDSKTEAGQYQTALTQLASVSGVNLGVGARTAATGATEIATELATLTYTPDKILFNLGSNDVAALPAEATWKADMGTILDAMHTKWANAQIYIMRPWKRGEAADCNSLATWIGDIVTARSTYCHLGPDERVFLEGGDDGVTYTADGIHPNAAGYTLTASQWISVAGL